jgi:hypothetical protein
VEKVYIQANLIHKAIKMTHTCGSVNGKKRGKLGICSSNVSVIRRGEIWHRAWSMGKNR